MPERGIWDVAHDPRVAEIDTLGGRLTQAEYRQRAEAHLIAATMCVLDSLAFLTLARRLRRPSTTRFAPQHAAVGMRDVGPG
jgi:hypothetical protein